MISSRSFSNCEVPEIGEILRKISRRTSLYNAVEAK